MSGRRRSVAKADTIFRDCRVSPQGGWQLYPAAYGMLSSEREDKTFVILATSRLRRARDIWIDAQPARRWATLRRYGTN